MEVIANAKPDIISLNEVEKLNASYGNIDQAAEIAKYMTSKTGKTWYQYMVVASGASKGIGNAIISRFALSAKNICSLSSTRNAVHATMTVNNRTFNFWSTHLAVESGTYRVAEATALVSCMSNYAQQRVVTGDFNAGTGTTEINKMAAGHVDGWAKAKSLGVTANYSGNCDGCTRNSRIDYMFISKQATGLVLKKIEMIDTRTSSGVMASDHKPMVTTFEVK
jgi:endonuclease/exonuclease/phosphatase family metal-dependent hydrolase